MQEPKRACPFWCSQSAVRCSLIADRCYQSIFQLYSLFAILSIFIHNSPISKGLLRTVFCIAARDCKPAADSLPAKARPPPPTVPAGRLEAPRKGIGRARCRTPQSALPTLPVCGARIMRHTLKRACILRPRHLLRLAVSAAGDARLRSPLQGSLSSGSAPQSLPCKGRCRRRRRRGAAPGPAIIFSGRSSAKTAPHRFLGAGLFCRDAGGPFGGQRPAASGVAVSETAASGVAGGASASSPRRHSRCSSSGICSATQVPSSCCVIPSSISG